MSVDSTTSLLAGELAKAAGVSRDTLRYYERKGVLAPPRRAANGYRLYPATALERVKLVRRALAVGFTLDELAKIFVERGRGIAPCQTVRQLAVSKLAELEERLGAMLILRDELVGIVRDWDARLAATESGTPAKLLEALPVSPNGNHRTSAKPGTENFQNNKRKHQK